MNHFLLSMIKKQISLVSAAIICMTFVSCDYYYLDLLGELKNNTEKVSISNVIFDKQYPLDSENVTSIPSSTEATVTFKLINPQNLTLNTSVTLPAKAVELATAASVTNLYTVTQSDDNSTILLTYSADFLKAVDGNDDEDTATGLRENDITPTLSFTDASDHSKTFGPFTEKNIRCNSVPSVATDALLFTKTPTSGTSTYVIFFNLPTMTATDKDITNLIITYGNTTQKFAVTPTGATNKTIVTDVDNGTSKLYSTWNEVSQGTLKNDDNKTATSSAYSIYFDTGLTTSSAESKTFTIALIDKLLLSSSITVVQYSPHNNTTLTVIVTIQNGIETMVFNNSSVSVKTGNFITLSAPTIGGTTYPFDTNTVCYIDAVQLTGTANNDTTNTKYNGMMIAYATNNETATLTPPTKAGIYTVSLIVTKDGTDYSLTFTLTVTQ